MGEGKLTPLTTPTPLNRQSRNIAHVIMSTISPHKRHLVKIAPRVTSPHIAKFTTQFFKISFCVRKIFYRPRAQAVEPILTRDTPTDAYSRRVVHFGGQKTIFSHHHPQNPQKPHFWAHNNGKPIENTYSHNCMMHRDTMLKFGALFDLAKYFEHT